MEERVKLHCKTFLGWEDTKPIKVEQLGKGCSNNILVAIKEDEDGTIYKVLVRMYGSVIREKVAQDVYINCYMSAIGRTPRILGLFEDGRLEEFISSSSMSRKQFSDDYWKIVKLMTEVHNLEMPVPREVALKWELRKMVALVEQWEWKSEVDWYLETLSHVEKEMAVRFCHNDVNMENLLVPESDPNKIILIDWEYAGFNYPVFDIANYCCEQQYDWSNTQPPYFFFNEDWLPDDDALIKMMALHKSLILPPIETSDETLLRQLKFMMIGSELFWTMWALSQEQSFFIDMKEYLEVKKASYFKKKEKYANDIRILMNL